MLGFTRRGVKASALLTVAVCVLAAGCFWRDYPARIVVHADVLVGIARKGVDLVEGRRFAAEHMPELTYPLERARAYAGDVRRHVGANPPPASLVAFETLLARYRDLVDTLDRVRRVASGPTAHDTLAPALAEVEAAAQRVREALGQEHVKPGEGG